MPGTIHIRPFESRAFTHLEASADPASSVPLPAFSPRASAVSLAGAEAVAPTSSLQEEACAAAGARLAEAFAAVERVGSGSARADRVQDEQFRGDCSVVP